MLSTITTCGLESRIMISARTQHKSEPNKSSYPQWMRAMDMKFEFSSCPPNWSTDTKYFLIWHAGKTIAWLASYNQRFSSFSTTWGKLKDAKASIRRCYSKCNCPILVRRPVRDNTHFLTNCQNSFSAKCVQCRCGTFQISWIFEQGISLTAMFSLVSSRIEFDRGLKRHFFKTMLLNTLATIWMLVGHAAAETNLSRQTVQSQLTRRLFKNKE